MKKSPALISLGFALAISIVTFIAWKSTSRNVDELPFMAAGVVLMFPFIWFFVWVVINTINWWRQVKDPPGEE